MRQDEQALLRIGFCVVCLHAGGLYWMTTASTPQISVFPPVKRCQVTTVLLPPKSKAETSPELKSKETAQGAVPKTEKPRPSPPKKSASPKKDKTSLERKKQLLAAAKEKMDRVRKYSKHDDLGEVNSLNIEALSSETYGKELSASLRQLLRLPEAGNVDIKLTLDRKGRVIKVETVHAASSLNRAYLENALPSLQLPPFGKHFNGEKERTFFVTLTHDS